MRPRPSVGTYNTSRISHRPTSHPPSRFGTCGAANVCSPGTAPGPRASRGLFEDGSRLVSAGKDGIGIWDALTGAELTRLGIPETCVVRAVLLSGGQHVLASLQNQRYVQVWNIEDRVVIRRLGGDFTASTADISPDGKSVLTGGPDGSVRLLGTRDRARNSAFLGSQRRGGACVFLSDGKRQRRGRKTPVPATHGKGDRPRDSVVEYRDGTDHSSACGPRELRHRSLPGPGRQLGDFLRLWRTRRTMGSGQGGPRAESVRSGGGHLARIVRLVQPPRLPVPYRSGTCSGSRVGPQSIEERTLRAPTGSIRSMSHRSEKWDKTL